MGNVVHKLTNQDIEQLLNQINFSTSNLPNGMKARTKYHDTVISIYNSGKVMFQGKHAEHIARQFCTTDSVTNSKSSKADDLHNITYNDYNCIGSDEAGSGVDDSKKLTDTKIIELAEQLITFIPHSLLTLNNTKYNERQALGWSQVKMKAVLHNEAIKNVTNKIDTKALDYIVIDQFAERNVYKRYALSDLPFPNQTKFETKGESKSLAIAAASIISRYAFIKHMDSISKMMHFDIPKGASHKVDLIAAQIIEKYNISKLDSISKKHFKNRDKAWTLVNKKYQ